MKKIFSVAIAFILLMMGFLAGGCSRTPSVSVTVFAMNGDGINTITTKKNSQITLYTPSNKYFEFDGWYTNKEYTDLFDVSSKITQDVKIYAKWVPKNQELSGIGLIAKEIQQIVMFAEKNDYNGINAQILACQYLRNEKYNSESWNLLCGIVPYSFKVAVQEEIDNDGDLCKKDNITYQEYSVDFVHFAATLNSVLKNGVNTQISNLCGLIGDLAQVAVKINGTTDEELYEQATAIIGASDDVFSSADFLADVMAVLIGNAALNQNVSFAELIEEYFSYSKTKLIAKFSDIYYSELTKDTIINVTTSQMSGLLINQWMSQNGGASSAAKTQTIIAFADYVLSWVIGGE